MANITSLTFNREQRKGTQEGTRTRQNPYRPAHNGLLLSTRNLLSTKQCLHIINLSGDELIDMSEPPRSSHLPLLQSHQGIAHRWQSSPQYVRLKDMAHLSTPVTESDLGYRSHNSR